MNRRDAFFSMTAGAAGLTNLFAPQLRAAPTPQETQARRGMPTLRITNVKAVLTAPPGLPRTVVVKIETNEAGIYGWGCATFTQRALVVHTAIEQYLKPFLIGRRVDEIEDIFQSMYVSSYWRNGGVLFNAMSGVDIALWDILGKRANLPLHQILGGKVRHGADCYYHASGRDFKEVEDNARKGIEAGFRHVRVQGGVPGMSTYGTRSDGSLAGSADEPIGPTNPRAIWESSGYVRMLPKLFAHLRTTIGDEVQLLHDVHERVQLNEAINLCKALEPYNLFFLEDPFPPEDNAWFRQLRQQTSVPLAMGELFNTVQEYLPLISERLIDFIRIHISQVGGLTPARKIAALSEFFGVRTAWHGPGDASPVAHAAQLALELSTYNFGIHEGGNFPPETREVFKGSPEQKNGYMVASDAPGHGVEVDEALAAKFPFPPGPPNFDYSWGTTRRRDGTVIRP